MKDNRVNKFDFKKLQKQLEGKSHDEKIKLIYQWVKEDKLAQNK